MAAPYSTSSSNASISTTEYSIVGNTTSSVPLSSATVAKVRVVLDLTLLVAGDDYEMKVYSKVNADTQRVLATYPLVGAYDGLWYSPEFWLYDAWDITLKKNSGADHVLRWTVMSDVGDATVSGYASGQAPLQPTVAGRTLDVTATGEAGIDWNNIGAPTTTVNLSGTSTKAVEPTVAGRTLDVSQGGNAGVDWANVEAPTTTLNLSGTSTKAVEPTVAGRTLDVTATGEAGIDWANVGAPTTTLNLTGTTIKNATDVSAAVTNIAVTTAALNAVAASRTTTTGSGSGGVGNTAQLDGIFDAFSDAAGTVDFYYEYDLSATSGAIGTSVFWEGYLAGAVNSLKVYARNWNAASWEQIGTISGIATTVESADEWALTNDHTQAGLVRIRFSNTGLTSATLNTDRMLLGYAVVPPTVAAIQSGLATASSLASTPASTVTALLATAHDSGVTLGGLFKRLEALVSGKVTGLRGTLVRFFLRDGTTVATEIAQVRSAGTRSTGDVSGSE